MIHLPQESKTVHISSTSSRSPAKARGKGKQNKERLVARRQTDAIGHLTNNSVAVAYMPIFNTAVRKRLTYYDSGSITTTSGVMSSYVFSINGLYDPNITGTGHQPAGFDQMMIFFDHYAVVRSRMTATFKQTSTASNNCAEIALSLNSTVTPTADQIILNETGYVVRDYLNTVGTNDSIKTLSLACNVGKFQGVKEVRDDPELHGTAAANPVEQSYYNLSVWDNNAITSVVTFQVLIEFDAWFIEPRKVSSSLASDLHKLFLKQERCVKR